MAFTLVQTVTDKKYNAGSISRWTDKGRSGATNGAPMGLLLALTYTN